ncbi:MAG: tetratricopeptide repeat protein [Nitrospinae bacterium]|nr:tetratricopeptide repeat protein [Nitrospinota bacterium]
MHALVKWGWACAIAGAAFLIFAGTFSNPFLHDDVAIIGENPLVRESGRILEAFTHDYWAVLETNEKRDRLYRPLTIASFSLNHAMGGLNPLGYRIVNALFHALACLALFWLCVRFGLSRGAAGAVSLLFALHPVHTEAVNAVVGRADLMAAAGVFGGLGLLMGVALAWTKPGDALGEKGGENDRGAPNRGVFAPVGLTCALCLFALLSKEIGVALLFSALLWWPWSRYVSGETRRPPLRHTLTAVFALLLVLIVYLWMRYAALGMLARPYPPSKLDNILALMPTGERIFGAVGVLGRYFKLLVWPWPLSMDYSFAQIPVEGAEAAFWTTAGGLGLLVWGYASWRLRKDMPWIAFGLVIFIGAYLPVSNLLIPMGTIMAERVLYIPSAGFLIALAPTAGVLLTKRDWRVAAALLVVACVLFGALTLKRNHEWGEALRFWRRTAEVSPNSARALRVYGQALIDRNRFREAVAPLKRSVAIYPVYDYAWVDLGIAQMQSGDAAAAETSLKRALRLNDENAEAHLALGVLLMGEGRGDSARPRFERAIGLKPSLVEARFNLGTLYLRAGLRRLAIAQFRAALRLEPGHGGVHHNLALGLYLEGDRASAREHARKAERFGSPLHPRLIRELGLTRP